jgi:hypothetical protein
MTWLGKILTFLVMIGAVMAAYFMVQAYVTRVNWKADRDKYKAAYEKAVAALDAELRRSQVREEVVLRQLAAERKASEDLAKQVKTLTDTANKTVNEFKSLQKAYDDGDVKAVQIQANVDRTLKELDTVRARNGNLEDRLVQLVLDIEAAKKERVRAENAAKLAQAIAEDNARKVEELSVRLAELKATGGSASAAVLRSFDKAPPPLLENLRGQVNRVLGDQLELSIGLDAGLAPGTVLDLYRTEGGGRYLGTVKVTSAANLYPKQAIVTFTPARGNIPLDRLQPAELPRKGDEVRPPAALTGNR